MIQELKAGYGDQFEAALIQEIAQVGTFRDVPEGSKLIEIGEYIKGMPLLISGVIKVMREDPDGDELLLYYLEQGDTCSMTMSCCMGQTRSEIRAVAETDVRLIMIPVRKMEEWTAKYRSWRNFVFDSYNTRLNEMLHAIDSIAFLNMDERLINYLREKARVNQDNTLHSTHQQIAYDLHSSRVVISRLLKKLENLGKIELHRNHIEILEL
ncbi:CRP/FNR family transcriptional regulator, anaerobic regulatory protein [Robiginitalea myxolifaciens]|uniref:CRP/FNR family transcriptional regulator, anaerobic regulatory protein n=1 Tax=Robiginitalea myxolifaciens TaxID=400055 RepID=A0A1I6G416_9FLAO|nr:Crp/Fnr family transcriptional regulator [Robiginitalea myxolifaciens]SFR36929.1 CRP/FNR family transcriptional regulator, anaerobic regulatory protein [Robiginitalea myxolifaciens]